MRLPLLGQNLCGLRPLSEFCSSKTLDHIERIGTIDDVTLKQMVLDVLKEVTGTANTVPAAASTPWSSPTSRTIKEEIGLLLARDEDPEWKETSDASKLGVALQEALTRSEWQRVVELANQIKTIAERNL